MEKTPSTETAFEYSMRGFERNRVIAEFDNACEASQIPDADYDTHLAAFAQQSLTYLTEGLIRFPQDFDLDIEAEDLARSLSGNRKEDFAIRFNGLLYESVSDPLRPIDPIEYRSRLQRTVDLIRIADRINAGSFYERPNRVRELGDAVVGRVVLTMISFNQDPRFLRIPVR